MTITSKTLSLALLSTLLFSTFAQSSQVSSFEMVEAGYDNFEQPDSFQYEPLSDSFDYITSLLQDDTYTLEWEIPSLSLKSIKLIGLKGEIIRSREEVLKDPDIHNLINHRTIVPEKSSLLRYWHFTSKDKTSKGCTNILVPQTVALGVKHLQEDTIGLIRGIIVEIDVTETDDRYKPKAFKRTSDGKLYVAETSEQRPLIYVRSMTKKGSLTEDAWLTTLDSMPQS